jgi:tellurite methyltransferase
MIRCSIEKPNIVQVYRPLWVVSILLMIINGFAHAEETRSNAPNAYQMITGDDSEEDRKNWDRLFNTKEYVFGTEPNSIVKESLPYLPKGRALDLFTGEGQNAVFLARQGFTVDAIDFSEVALRKARRLARQIKVSIETITADLSKYTIKPESYQVIINVDYMLKSLIAEIKKGLKKGGVIVFQSYTVDQLQNQAPLSVPREALLKKGELRELFKEYKVLLYRESNDGKSAVATLIARKPE